MKSKSSNNNFEEKYFEGYYKGAVGSFSSKDLDLSRKWFSAWLNIIKKLVFIC